MDSTAGLHGMHFLARTATRLLLVNSERMSIYFDWLNWRCLTVQDAKEHQSHPWTFYMDQKPIKAVMETASKGPSCISLSWIAELQQHRGVVAGLVPAPAPWKPRQRAGWATARGVSRKWSILKPASRWWAFLEIVPEREYPFPGYT